MSEKKLITKKQAQDRMKEAQKRLEGELHETRKKVFSDPSHNPQMTV